MPTRLLLLADTHVPARARDLPTEVWVEVDRADVIVHAGDWTDAGLVDRLAARLAPRGAALLGCHGNNDGADVRERLPEVARATVEGLRLAVVHETGPAGGREGRMDEAFPGTDVLVFGHSHIPWDTVSPAGLRLLNPGSPTDRRRQPACTFATAVADDGALAVTWHELPRRTGRTSPSGRRGGRQGPGT